MDYRAIPSLPFKSAQLSIQSLAIIRNFFRSSLWFLFSNSFWLLFACINLVNISRLLFRLFRFSFDCVLSLARQSSFETFSFRWNHVTYFCLSRIRNAPCTSHQSHNASENKIRMVSDMRCVRVSECVCLSTYFFRCVCTFFFFNWLRFEYAECIHRNERARKHILTDIHIRGCIALIVRLAILDYSLRLPCRSSPFRSFANCVFVRSFAFFFF